MLCGRIRQQKCPHYATQLLPIVTQLLARQDDSLQVSNQKCYALVFYKIIIVFCTIYRACHMHIAVYLVCSTCPNLVGQIYCALSMINEGVIDNV